MEKRERLGSRLGFIMLSAGCAIGCGNVWKFPWMCGRSGGGIFALALTTALGYSVLHFQPFVPAAILFIYLYGMITFSWR